MDNNLPPGSIKIDKIELNNFNGDPIEIKSIVEEFSIYESLDQKFVTAEIQIKDALALTSEHPIIGQEIINISFRTPHSAFQKSIELELQVFGMINLRMANERTEDFTLLCASPELLQNQKTKILKSYASIPISDMVQSIFDEFILSQKPLKKDQTSGTRTIVIPNMTPAKALSFLAKESYAGDSSNFFFFQTCDGFYFRTLDGLVKNRINPVIDQYNVTQKDLSPEKSPRSLNTTGRGGAGRQSNKPFEFTKIEGFNFETVFNYNQTQLSGGLENTFQYLDPLSHTYYERQYDYSEDWNQIARISKNSPHKKINDQNQYSGERQSYVSFAITNTGQLNLQENDQKPEFHHLMKGSVALLEDMNLTITVPGDSERRAGDIININFPEFSEIEKLIGKKNRYLAGEYLVYSVRHIYNSEKYTTVMRVVKNAYESEIGSEA